MREGAGGGSGAGAGGWIEEQARVDEEHKRLRRKGVYEGENTLGFVLFCCCDFFTYIVRTALLQSDIVSFKGRIDG